MLKVLVSLQNFLAEPLRRDDRGVTAVEYAVLLVMIGGAVATAIALFGGALANVFKNFNF